jgi:hypothetical protein
MNGHKKPKMSNETSPPCVIEPSLSVSSSSPPLALSLPHPQRQQHLECPYNDGDWVEYCRISDVNLSCVCELFPTIITQQHPITTSVSTSTRGEKKKQRFIADIPLRFIDNSCPSFTDAKHSSTLSSLLSLPFSSTPLRYRCTKKCREDDHQAIETHPTVMILRSMIDNMKVMRSNGSDDGKYQTSQTYSKWQRLLPRDIIGMIFAYIDATCSIEAWNKKVKVRTGWVKSNKPDLRDSTACEVVCRQWYLVAQQYGFSQRTFDTQNWLPYDDCDHNGTILESQQQFHHVAVTFMYRIGTVHFQPSKINHIRLNPGREVVNYSQFLAQFPSLTHVTIYHYFEDDDFDWNHFFPITLPSLTVTSFESRRGSHFTLPLNISLRLPCLQSLILNNLHKDEEENNQLLMAINSLSNLTHLDIASVGWEVRALSLPLLRTLRFKSIFSIGAIDETIQVKWPWCSRQLLTLNLDEISVSEMKHIISVSSSIIDLSIPLGKTQLVQLEGGIINPRIIESSDNKSNYYEHLFAIISTMTSLQSLSLISSYSWRIDNDHPSILLLTSLTKLTSLTYPTYNVSDEWKRGWQLVASSLPLLTPDHINREIDE